MTYTQYFNITPPLTVTTLCLIGSCAYFQKDVGTAIAFLGYGHHVTITLLASTAMPTRIGVYSNTSGEFAIDFMAPAAGQSLSHDFPLTDTYIEFEFQPTSGFDWNVRVDYDLAPGETAGDDFCAYGTRVQPGVQNAEVITEALVAASAIAVPELTWAEVAFGALIGFTWVPGNVCAGPPPSIPPFSPGDFIAGTDIPLPGTFPKLLQLFEAVNWGRVCECIPASGMSPPAVPFPPPTFGAPPSTAPLPPPPLVCDNADICTTLNRLEAELLAVSGAVGRIGLVTNLIQRQEVPFAYVPGAVHPGLSGLGQLATSGILGLACEFTALPLSLLSPALSDPATYHQIGKLTLGTADGWQRSYEPTHSPYLILGVSGAVTEIGYAFADGVVATLTELVREP